jgi:hypothetical protein
VSIPVAEAKVYVQSQPIVGADETGFGQGNADGQNPHAKRAWLWVAWLFVTVEGLEPTNNAAERAIRPAVLWRRTSFGSQSEAGSVFVARMLTVVTSLRSQNRNVAEKIVKEREKIEQQLKKWQDKLLRAPKRKILVQLKVLGQLSHFSFTASELSNHFTYQIISGQLLGLISRIWVKFGRLPRFSPAESLPNIMKCGKWVTIMNVVQPVDWVEVTKPNINQTHSKEKINVILRK